ncbi:G5 domain-containing protein [Gracilibacillus marinus]|uniref:G5 domain-containing protein n=1 Tax=Gracilibacillus marinus TaxID=630535 RepID=A0ABV8VR09_9BACI
MHKGIHNKKFVIFNSIMIVIVIGIIVIGSNYQKQSLETTTEQVANYENNRVIYMKEKNVIANEQLFVKEDESLEDTVEEETEEEPEVEEETESIPLYTAKDTTETENDLAPTKPSKKPTTTNNTSTNEASTEVEDIKDKDTVQEEDEGIQKEKEVEKEEEKKPAITTKTVKENISIPYQEIAEGNPGLLVGESKITQQGVNGIRTITYKETYEDDKLIKRVEVSSKITKEPIHQITEIGIKEESSEIIESEEE